MLVNALFHHVGVATRSMEKSSALYRAAGYTVSKTVFDPIQNVNIAFLEKEGGPLIELVEPVDTKSPVFNILKKVGVSAYHFCYEVNNLEESIEILRARDFILLVEPVEAVAFNGRKICFLYHVDVGLVELLNK